MCSNISSGSAFMFEAVLMVRYFVDFDGVLDFTEI